jgi:hypothetical protein
MPQSGRPARRAFSRPVCAHEKNPALSVDRKLFGTSTIGSHPVRSAPTVAPHDPPRSADACRSAIGRPILYPQPLSPAGHEASTKPPGGRPRRDPALTVRKTPLQGVSQAFLERLWGPGRPRPRLTSRSSAGNRLRTCHWPGYPQRTYLDPMVRYSSRAALAWPTA